MTTTTHMWQLDDAKAQLDEIVRCARDEGPQVICVGGDHAAIVLSAGEYERLLAPRPRTMKEALLNAPALDLSDEEIDEMFARDNSDSHSVVSFDD